MNNANITKILSLAIALMFTLGSYLVFINADGTEAEEQIFSGSSNDNVVVHITVMEKEKGSIWSGNPPHESKGTKITFQAVSKIWCKTGTENGDHYIMFSKTSDAEGSKFYLRPVSDDYVFGDCGYGGTIIEDKPFLIKSTNETVYVDVHFKDKNEVGSFTELQQLIASNSSVITLEKDYVCNNETENGLLIDKDVTINLNGYKIDRGLSAGKENGYVIKVYCCKLTIEDCDETAPCKYGKICGGNNSLTGGNEKCGGGILVESGKLIINGGSVCNNDCNTNGGGIGAINHSEVVLNRFASVSYNGCGNIIETGGGIYLHQSSLTMNGGCVACNGNFSYVRGGGIRAVDGNIEINSDAVILLNKASDGGGISLSDNTSNTLTMKGGFISDNSSECHGSGIYVGSESVFNMEGGVISYNLCTFDHIEGGAIYSEGKVNIVNGIIEKNAAMNKCGGILFDEGTLTLGGDSDGTGCIIRENYASRLSGDEVMPSGIYFGSNPGKLTISGLVKITDNEIGYYDSDEDFWYDTISANVKSYENAELNGKLTEGSLIQIDDELEGEPKQVLSDAPAGTEKYFTTGNTGESGVVWVNNSLYLAPKCGTNVYWTVVGTSLGIAGIEGRTYDFDQNENNVAPWGKNITDVYISGTKRIGNNAFFGCDKIICVTFDDTLEEIGESTFENCVSLETMIFPESLKKMGGSALKGCYGIAEIEFGGDMTENSFGDDSLSLGTEKHHSEVRIKTNGWIPEKVLSKRILGNYTTVHVDEKKEETAFPIAMIAIIVVAIAIIALAGVLIIRKRKV